jgi:hypothetical protein
MEGEIAFVGMLGRDAGPAPTDPAVTAVHCGTATWPPARVG